jgi:hypothetical protein
MLDFGSKYQSFAALQQDGLCNALTMSLPNSILATRAPKIAAARTQAYPHCHIGDGSESPQWDRANLHDAHDDFRRNQNASSLPSADRSVIQWRRAADGLAT